MHEYITHLPLQLGAAAGGDCGQEGRQSESAPARFRTGCWRMHDVFLVPGVLSMCPDLGASRHQLCSTAGAAAPRSAHLLRNDRVDEAHQLRHCERRLQVRDCRDIINTLTCVRQVAIRLSRADWHWRNSSIMPTCQLCILCMHLIL